MKVCKIKNLDKNIIQDLIAVIDEEWICETNYPTENSYVIVKEGKIIPAYLSIKGDEALTLWVHKSQRRKGYATFLINSLNIKHARAHHSSVSFWKTAGFLSKGNSGIFLRVIYKNS